MGQASNQPDGQPLAMTKAQWEVNGRDLLKNLSKAAINAIAQNWPGAAADLVEAGATISRNHSQVGAGWQLIYNALGRATLELLQDNQVLLVYDDRRLDADLQAISEQVDLSIPLL